MNDNFKPEQIKELRKRAPGGGRPPAPKSTSVRAIRNALGLTQEKMAARLGCTLNTLQKMEAQNRLPADPGIMKRLKRASTESGIAIELLATETQTGAAG